MRNHDFLVVSLLCCHCSPVEQTETGTEVHTYTHIHISVHLSVYLFTFLHFETAYAGTSNSIPTPQSSLFSSPFQIVTPFPSSENLQLYLLRENFLFYQSWIHKKEFQNCLRIPLRKTTPTSIHNLFTVLFAFSLRV